MPLFHHKKKFEVQTFQKEDELEKAVFDNHRFVFGPDTILIKTKQKLKSGILGNTIPDGILFDFSNLKDPRMFLIEIELESHSFYEHIFPQITKFFAFLRNGNSNQSELIEKLFVLINSDPGLKTRFKQYIGNAELFKFLKDTVEDAKDILLIFDNSKPELTEIKTTYPETWEKYVKVLTYNEYSEGKTKIFSIEPDFESIRNSVIASRGANGESAGGSEVYDEHYHLDDTSEDIRFIYKQIKKKFSKLTFNPQAYYISIRDEKNFAYLRFSKNKIRLTVMLPFKRAKLIVRHSPLKNHSEGVQNFYNGECCEITVSDKKNIREILRAIGEARNYRTAPK